MKKRGIDKDIVILLISTLITVASWVGFEVYRAYMKINVTPEVEQHLEQVNPILDVSFFKSLEELDQ